MWAIIAAILFLLAALGVDVGSVNLVWLALAALSVHFAWDYRPWVGRVR